MRSIREMMLMLQKFNFAPGDIVELKKRHPCGGRQWEIIRAGADFRIRCLGCGHQVMLPRPKFEKSVKKIAAKEKGGLITG